MNKQKYLAELQRLLVFMTEEDRELTVRRYGEIFDAVGPGGEEELVASLGSPTKAAIGLSRGYEPGTAEKRLPPIPAPPEPEPAPAPAPKQEPWDALPDFEPPETPSPRKKPASRPVKPVKVPAEPALRPEQAFEDPDEWPELPPRGAAGPTVVYEHSVPLGLGIPLFILLTLALFVPLGFVCLALTAVFLAPGAAIVFGAYLLFVGGLWSLAIMADAILLFGAALIVLALGLFVLTLGLWLAVWLWKLWGRAVGWLSGELLGRRVTEYE